MVQIELCNTALNLNFKAPVKVGELEATLHAAVWVYDTGEGRKNFDCEFMDVEDISYMGMKIEGYDNWKKFKNFHKEMGIDFDKILNDKFSDIFTEKSINALIKRYGFCM